MHRSALALLCAGLLGVTAAGHAQVRNRPALQFSLGYAMRDLPTESFASHDGVKLGGSIGFSVRSHLLVVGELSLIRFATVQRPAGLALCPFGAICAQQFATMPGTTLGEIAVGLQPRLSAGSFDFLFTGMAGGYVALRHPSGTRSALLGLGGRLAVVGPGSGPVRPMVEAGTTRLFDRGSSGRWLSAVNVGLHVQ